MYQCTVLGEVLAIGEFNNKRFKYNFTKMKMVQNDSLKLYTSDCLLGIFGFPLKTKYMLIAFFKFV